ncbi:MAG: Ig-like domain repeat protein [Paenibacillus sp.]|uniref:FecR domain-containing protein n=1 Tax=Paenibacillus sp. TaxID=58172 RepID=UPI002904A44B|nr:FecR domain-containing protein [Paenibacillus sp.]MDU2239725.1 Ig-like domain repeat protein [Paenibacillus sp.]
MRTIKRLALCSIILVIVLAAGIAGIAETAFGAAARKAIATEVVGEVYVAKSGGTKELRVFDGMTFEEGDLIHVGKGGSLTLRVSDRDDEIVLGENWSGTLSKLRKNASGGTETAFHTWSGSMMNSVQDLAGTHGSYQVETPTTEMGVQGTHFMVAVDPVLGSTYAAVLSGRVAVSPMAPGSIGESGGVNGSGGMIVLPAQQIEMLPQSSPANTVIDPQQLIPLSANSVLASLIESTGKIDQELQQQVSTPAGQTPLSSDYYQDSIQRIINQSNGLLSQQEIQSLLDQAHPNGGAPSSYAPFRPVTAPANPLANDPEYVKRQEQLAEAKAKQQQQIAAKEEKKLAIIDSNQTLIQQIQQQAEELRQQNERKAQEKMQEAIDRYLSDLAEAQRNALEDRIQQKEAEKIRQQQGTKNPGTKNPPDTKQPSDGSSGGGSSGGNSPGPVLLATSTTVQVSPASIYAGEPFVLTARVTISQTERPVPDGTSVAFRIGTQTIATASTLNGVATASISSEESFAKLNAGDYSVSALTAGTSTTQASTSFPAVLKVNKGETTTAVTTPHREVRIGETIPFTVRVTPPHGSTPITGDVKLYEADRELATGPLGADGTVTFNVPIEGEATGEPRTYRAVFAGTEKLAGSEGTVQLLVSEMELPAYAFMRIERISPTQLQAVISLDRFAGEMKLYEAELEIAHGTGLELQQGEGITYYNSGKFTPSTVSESVYVSDGEYDGEAVKVANYSFSVEGGIAFEGEEVFALFPFTIVDPLSSERITVISWRFYDQDGNPIEVRTEEE